MKIKVIDLLNKIANGEELPNEIKYGGIIYKRYEYNNKYYKNDDRNREKDILSEHLANESFYNSGIEIIEEDKEIEPLKLNDSDVWTGKSDGELITEKINELIKAVNELKKGK